MTIGSYTTIRRSPPANRNSKRLTSMAISMAGDVQSFDFERKVSDVVLVFLGMEEYTAGGIVGVRDLESYLRDTIKPGGSVSVVPDWMDPPTNSKIDDLGIGATSSGVTLYFKEMSAVWVVQYKWNVTIIFKYVA